VDQAPDHAESRHAWTILMVGSGRKEQATKLAQDWLKQKPQLAAPYVETAWLLVREGDLDQARAGYQKALDRDPRNPRALVELAEIYEKLGRPDRALVLYERSLQARPDQPAVARAVKELRARGIDRPHPD
jgi:Tfp pilus assembly protein PilF